MSASAADAGEPPRGGLGRTIAIAAGAAVVVALVGGLATDTGAWYQGLRKPSWQPPGWAFGPAWTLIFALTATAGVVAWRAAPSMTARHWLISLFSINALLNIGWSVVFFSLKRPDWALVEVALLWLSILILVLFLWRFTRTGALLLLPYLAWVSFASVLNFSVARLNAPFA
jgi:tryptophan-rich sensory protein